MYRNRKVKKSTSRQAEAPPRSGVAELHLLEMHDKMVKMVVVMVLMSTGHVEPHTAR